MPGTLFLVAVPIGNADDLSPARARDAAGRSTWSRPKTRATSPPWRGITTSSTRAVSYHDHNEVSRARELIGRLQAGEDVALVSDAGTPLVSDPGYRLVRAAIDAGMT